MYSFARAAIAILLFVGTQAQSQYYVDPTTVPLGTRDSWCTSQKRACPLLCLQLPGSSATTHANTCDPATLTYQCICGNGLQPNASEYSQTLPYFICTEWGQQCVANCSGSNTCQSACIQDHPCGAQNPTRVNLTSTSSTMTETATSGSLQTSSGVVYNGLGGSQTAVGSSQSTSTPSGAQAALSIGRSYGFGAVIAGLFAAFTLAL
jgi:hypothetical protein